MKKLSITYSSGSIHFYNVISQKTFENVIKPAKLRIREIESLSVNGFKKYSDEYKKLKNLVKSYGKFCTDDSPIFKSVETQILSLGKNQGGYHNVISKFI